MNIPEMYAMIPDVDFFFFFLQYATQGMCIWQVRCLSPDSAVRDRMAPLALITVAERLIIYIWHINYSPRPSNPLCRAISKKKKKKSQSKQTWDAGLQQPEPGMSAVNKDRNSSARSTSSQNCKFLWLVNLNYLSLLTSVLAFHLVR